MKKYLIHFFVFTALVTSSMFLYAPKISADQKVQPSPGPAPTPTPSPAVSPAILNGLTVSPSPSPTPTPSPAAGGVVRRPATGSEGRQRFEGEASPSCPFQEPSPNTMALVSRVQNALRTLQNEANECQQIQGLVAQAQTSLDGLMRDQAQETFSSDSAQTNCSNYEGRLRRQFDVAVAESRSRAVRLGGSSAYSTCDGDSRGFEVCAEEIYVQQLSQRAEACGYTSRNRENQQIRASLENLTQLTTQIIEGAGNCSPQTAQAVVQTAIAQATATASMASGFGLVGLGVSMAGRLLSSIAGRLFSNNAPERFLRDIGNEISRPSRFCLFYDVQKAALRCEAAIYQDAVSVQGALNPDLCEGERNAIFNLIRSSDAIRTQLQSQSRVPASGGAASGDSSRAGPAPIQNLDDRTRSFIESLDSPVAGTNKKYIDVLRDMATSFGREGSSVIDRNYANQLRRAVALYDELNGQNNTNLTADQLTSKTLELTNILLGQPTEQGSTAGMLDLPDALQRYLTSPGQGGSGTVADTLNQSRSIAEIIRQTNREAEMARDILRTNADERITDRLLSATVTTLRGEFVDQLKNLNEQYQRYGSAQSDPTSRMTWLGEMLAICMTTQGMSYFPNHRDNSRLNMQSTPNRDYQSICQQFSCPNNSLYVPFDPSQIPNGTLVDKFSKYQCASDRRFPQALQQLRNNLQSGGTICGN